MSLMVKFTNGRDLLPFLIKYLDKLNMKNLYNYIVESAFNNKTDNIDRLYNVVNIKIPKEIFIKFTHNISDISFIYSKTESRIKIPYEFKDELLENAKSIKEIEVKRQLGNEDSDKEKVRFKYNNKIFAELGYGSAGKISTSKQEETTVRVYNTYVSSIQGSLCDELDIENLVGDLFEEFDKTWKISFKKQLEVLTQYIQKLGEDPRKYRMCRYDRGKIGNAYAGMIKRYQKDLDEKVDRNIIDPSDTILYSVEDEDYIFNTLNNILTVQEYEDKLYNKKLCIGISLKKLNKNSKSVDEFNNGEEHIIKVINCEEMKPKKVNNKGYYFRVEVETSFEPTPMILNGELRYFNVDKGEAIEFKPIKGNYRAGKVSSGLWKKLIGVKPGDTLNDMQAKLKNVIDNKEFNILLQLVKGSFKEWDKSYPYLLLH